jgi:hypothetical protein
MPDMSLLQGMVIKWFRGKALDSHGKRCCAINCLDMVFSSPKHTAINWILSPGLKRMRRVDNQSLPSGVEFKE